MNKLLQISLAISIVIIVVVGMLGTIVFVNTKKHDRTLLSLKKSFDLISHPEKTKIVAQFSKLGVLSGNGNHCDYFVGQLRKTNLSPNEIIAWYKKTGKISSDVGRDCDVMIEFYSKGKLKEYDAVPFDYEDLSQLIPHIENNQNYYLIYVFDTGYDAGWDYRCH